MTSAWSNAYAAAPRSGVGSAIVAGIAASHSTLMNTHAHLVGDEARTRRFLDGLDAARSIIARAKPDLAIIVGTNHFRGLWLDLMPAFTLGVGEVVATGEAGTPVGPQTTRPEIARELCRRLIDDSFDAAFSVRLQVDHGISQAAQLLPAGLDVPLLPVVVNAFAPPLPSLKRCDQFGLAIRRAIQQLPGDLRVVVIASGGLSHSLPWPDWRRPSGSDEEFMVKAWAEGRDRWAEFDPRRREIILRAEAELQPSFDEHVLRLVENGRLAELADGPDDLSGPGGNGANEIRTWLVMGAALGHLPGKRLAYEQMPEWLTGMAVAAIETASTSPHKVPQIDPAGSAS